MSRLRHIEIDGKRYLWRDIRQLRREQKKAVARAMQPTLFELKDDRRPIANRHFSPISHDLLFPAAPISGASGTLAAAACCQ
jgi:hypothetical protein